MISVIREQLCSYVILFDREFRLLNELSWRLKYNYAEKKLVNGAKIFMIEQTRVISETKIANR